MILADTSAWIEYLRRTHSSADRAMQSLRAHEVSITDPVLMELLAGAPEPAAARLQKDLVRMNRLEIAPTDYEHAAGIYRNARRAGWTLRNQIDCLIAAVAIRADIPVLHHDADFDFIAAHSPLRVYELAG